MTKQIKDICVSGYKKGLTVNQIKWIALIFMTIDHLGAYGFPIPIFDKYFELLRILGRIAAPLFLFGVTESVKHTRNKWKFVLRLYLGAVAVGLFVTVTNYLFDDSIGRFTQSNILFTYFYVALYIVLIEQLIESVKTKEWKRGIIGVFGMIATSIPHILFVLFYNFPFDRFELPFETVWALRDLFQSFIQSPLGVEYTILFVVMGVVMYFVGNKLWKAAVLLIVSALCYFGGNLGAHNLPIIGKVLGYPQYYMAMAVPFILLYNGQKGRGSKYFFYVYYPLHRYVISIIVYIYSLLAG